MQSLDAPPADARPCQDWGSRIPPQDAGSRVKVHRGDPRAGCQRHGTSGAQVSSVVEIDIYKALVSRGGSETVSGAAENATASRPQRSKPGRPQADRRTTKGYAPCPPAGISSTAAFVRPCSAPVQYFEPFPALRLRGPTEIAKSTFTTKYRICRLMETDLGSMYHSVRWDGPKRHRRSCAWPLVRTRFTLRPPYDKIHSPRWWTCPRCNQKKE